MTIRTTEDLIAKVDAQLIWRRKELTTIRGLVEASDGKPAQRTILIRAGVTLLYAHWEGFVKTAGTYFLQFVAAQRLTCAQLAPNFVGVVIRAKLNVAAKSMKVSTTVDIITFFDTKMSARVQLPVKNVIDTESNLSSIVLREILWILGLDEGPYNLKKNVIDNKLLGRRNAIAHGEILNIDIDEYLLLHDDVMGLLEEFRTQIENACVVRKFMRN